MTVILGIDAAWTKTEPSGIALVELTQEDWQSIAVAPSYNAFINTISFFDQKFGKEISRPMHVGDFLKI
ncbi:MAG: hypothetical protein ABR534_04885 [Desulfotignum sp.]|nr:hypothetical protein [Desulfobacteraceae bacterium]